VPLEKIKENENNLKTGKTNPKDIKKELAFEIVKTYNSQKDAEKAKKEFEEVFERKQLPSNVKEFYVSRKTINILDLLVDTKLASSKSKAKMLVIQGGVRLNGEIWNDWKKDVKIESGIVINVGKRNFVKIK
jgi:tyrosyl-tRNA synthetase